MSKPIILILDDDHTVLSSLKDQLIRGFEKKYDIEKALTIEEAQDIINNCEEDGLSIKLIISDWLMPPFKTNDFLVKCHERYPQTPIMMLSGYADEAAVEHARQFANLRAFVRKPWDEDELISEAHKVINS